MMFSKMVLSRSRRFIHLSCSEMVFSHQIAQGRTGAGWSWLERLGHTMELTGVGWSTQWSLGVKDLFTRCAQKWFLVTGSERVTQGRTGAGAHNGADRSWLEHTMESWSRRFIHLSCSEMVFSHRIAQGRTGAGWSWLEWLGHTMELAGVGWSTQWSLGVKDLFTRCAQKWFSVTTSKRVTQGWTGAGWSRLELAGAGWSTRQKSDRSRSWLEHTTEPLLAMSDQLMEIPLFLHSLMLLITIHQLMEIH